MFAFDERERPHDDDLWRTKEPGRDGRGARPVQRKASGSGSATPATAAALEHWAESGVEGDGGALPHLATLEEAFGPRHDLAGIQAHVGGAAADASEHLGAEAYATGNQVAFAGAPDLHTAAHEAAHVVQQRAGVQLKGGLGPADDEHERHADAVADQVVAGQSAEDFLPRSARATPAAGAAPVQRKATKSELDLDALADEDEVKLDARATQVAIGADNKRWQNNFRAQLLGFLRGTDPVKGGSFGPGDVQTVAQLQKNAGAKPDGIIGDQTMAVLLNAGFVFSDDVHTDKAHPTGKVKPGEVTIEFWPGELEDQGAWDTAIKSAEKDAVEAGDGAPFRHLDAPDGEGRLYVKVGGRLVAQYRARGGPPRKVKDSGGHTADPTQGSFTVGAQQKGFTTSAWLNSTIPWGAQVRKGASGYEYQNNAGHWQRDVGAVDDGTFASLPQAEGGDPDVRIWNQNDFGKMAYRLQGSPGFYLHTTPETESQAALGEDVKLDHSHGCVHLDPNQRDEMIAHGYLQPGVHFVCKKYSDQLLPGKAKAQMMGGG